MKLTGLSRTLLGYPSYRNVVAAAQLPATERSAQTLIGAVPGLHAPLIADIAAAIRNSTRREGAGKEPLTLVITPTERQAEDTAHALGAICPITTSRSCPPGKLCPMSGSHPAATPSAAVSVYCAPSHRQGNAPRSCLLHLYAP